MHHCCFNHGLMSFFLTLVAPSRLRSYPLVVVLRAELLASASSTVSVLSAHHYKPLLSASLLHVHPTYVFPLAEVVRSRQTQLHHPHTFGECDVLLILPHAAFGQSFHQHILHRQAAGYLPAWTREPDTYPCALVDVSILVLLCWGWQSIFLALEFPVCLQFLQSHCACQNQRGGLLGAILPQIF